MVKTRPFSFIWARDAEELRGGQRTLFWIWNAAALLASSALIAAMSLLLATGPSTEIDGRAVFFNYFQHPSLFLLNWLPVLLLQLLLYSLTGRQWLAYLLNGLLFITASIGNYYKIKLRYEPFVFTDIKLIRAGLGVASDYDLTPGSRIALAVLSVALGTLLLLLLVRGRPGKKPRAACALAILAAVFPLWRFVYSSDRIYNDQSVLPAGALAGWEQQFSLSKGFVYPFIHSIKYADTKPEGYSEAAAAELLSGYEDAGIPEDRRVNILAFQLEAFSDLSRLGLEGLSPEAYATYHRLEEESYTGSLIVNVYGGGTLNPERCFLSGSYYLGDYSKDSYSNVRYLRGQDYAVVGSHPYLGDFFSRRTVNEKLGFEEYWFYDDHYEALTPWDGWYPDFLLLPEVLAQYQSYTEAGKNVFSFNVTTQNHGPYETGSYAREPVYWPGEGHSDYARNVINNYLAYLRDTQEDFARLLDQLREDPAPVVVLLYGDHKPWMGDNASVLHELGINIDPSTEEGFMNYYSTRYLIWANEAAKKQLGEDFVGEGPDVSAGFLMNLLFEKLGWKGSAFIQFGDEIRQTLPVVTSNGYYYENGQLTDSLSPEGQKAFRDLDFVTYYVNKGYSFTSEEEG